MKKRLLACLLTLLMVVSMIPVFGLSTFAATEARTMTQLIADGDIAAHNERITISTAAELKLLADYVNSGNHAAYVTFELLKDIELNAGEFSMEGAWYLNGTQRPATEQPENFVPIGTPTAPFIGFFNGNGHTVNGL